MEIYRPGNFPSGSTAAGWEKVKGILFKPGLFINNGAKIKQQPGWI